MLKAERRIAELRAAYLARTAGAWRGHERVFLIELVRALDEAAFAFTMAPNRDQLVRDDDARHAILWGAASALRPFLEAVQNDSSGVPWAPTSPELSSLADRHLLDCGLLTNLQRLAALERYGLANASFLGDDHLILEVTSDGGERAEKKSGAWLVEWERQRLAAAEARLAAMKSQVAKRIDGYADVHDGWFIRYDPDRDMIEYHRDYATVLSAGIAEASALPSAALLGGRSFADWNSASLTALGRLLHHVACVTRLKATNPDLKLRNLLTVFARKEDIIAVWREAGEVPAWARRVVAALTLDADGAIVAECEFETPLPYYIDFGRHFVLLPMFGGLLNPHAGLLWHLRRKYRSDWDRAVDGREEVFRRDLQELFPAPRYVIPDHGMRLKRADGSHLTDVDATVLNGRTASLTLVQLKWPDVYGRSLAQRNSRRVNLLKANEWVSRVHEWIAGRSSGEIARALNLGDAGECPPEILIVTRHIARFVGEAEFDQRAHWISWPRLVQLRTRLPGCDVSELLAEDEEHEIEEVSESSGDSTTRYQLPGLTVEVRVS